MKMPITIELLPNYTPTLLWILLGVAVAIALYLWTKNRSTRKVIQEIEAHCHSKLLKVKNHADYKEWLDTFSILLLPIHPYYQNLITKNLYDFFNTPRRCLDPDPTEQEIQIALCRLGETIISRLYKIHQTTNIFTPPRNFHDSARPLSLSIKPNFTLPFNFGCLVMGTIPFLYRIFG